MTSPPQVAALEGIRVLDLANESAVFASRILADLGADVVRVEPPDGGSVRSLRPFLEDTPGVERAFYHLYHNANKRSVTLDVAQPEGAGLLRRLASAADVLIETETPGRMSALGLGYADLRALNPRLIYVSVTPFGQDNVWADRGATDLIAGAAGGLVYVTGQPEDPPVHGGIDPAYKMASLAAAAGVMFALTGRDLDPAGDGGHIDISLQEAVMMSTLQTANINIYTQEGRVPGRPGISGAYECADGKWFAMNVRVERFGALLDWAREAGVETDLTEADFPTASAGGVGGPNRLTEFVAQLAKATPRDEFVSRAQGLDMFCLPTTRLNELAGIDHYQFNEQFISIPQEGLGRSLSFVRSPADSFGDVPLRPAPALGAHNSEVFGELGLDASALEDLRSRGVV